MGLIEWIAIILLSIGIVIGGRDSYCDGKIDGKHDTSCHSQNSRDTEPPR